MSRPTPQPQRWRSSEPMWPLDVGIAIVGTLIGYTILSQLDFNDPRPLYNAWTYAILVPTGVIVLSLLSRLVASRFLEKSAQLGFLASVFVHLLLLLMAVNVIVFGRYFPEAFTGAQPKQVAKPKTVPEYLFSVPSQQPAPPDWSRPVDAETASQQVPIEQRLVPPVEKTASRLQMPNQELTPPREPEKFLLPRQTPESSLPMPADAPGVRSKSSAQPIADALAPAAQSPAAVPEVPADAAPRATPAQRPAEPDRRTAASSGPSAVPAPPTPGLTSPTLADAASSSVAARAAAADRDQLPTIGNLGASAQRTAAQQRQRVLEAAGAAPAPVTVAVARQHPAADRVVSPVETPLTRGQAPVGASLNPSSEALPAESSRMGVSSLDPRASIAEASSGVPSVSAGVAAQATSRRRTGPIGVPGLGTAGDALGIAGLESLSPPGDPSAASDAVAGGTGQSGSAATGQSADPLSRPDMLQSEGSRATAATGTGSPASATPLDFDLPLGPGGLADTPTARAGVSVSLDDQPQIAAISLRPSQRRRLDVGGPMQPVGGEIAAVEPFNRRMMRTRGSGAPTPAGLVGPETEEAIERGLKYLASRQRPEGHWSLQGHEEPVLLQSDTAATGLCLLSFQGAGYTHLQHQYAGVVSSGLQALLAMQSSDGNLYRSENPISDQNVAFYSHGIAALALCEAYGMSGDSSLREPAQLAIDYIVKTQHQERGGWRYQPQVSSDTSVSGWMMMALKSGELAGLDVPRSTYEGIDRWLEYAKLSRSRADLYRYNPFAPDTPSQRHGREVTPPMTAVAMLMRMYSGWRRDNPDMQRAADYLAKHPPMIGDARNPQRDTYYWYYATQVMFHMGGEHWDNWNRQLKPVLLNGQIKSGPLEGSWDPRRPVPDRWSLHAGRLYLTTMNLLSLEVYYRHLPIYDDTAK